MQAQSSFFALLGGVFWFKHESLEDSANIPYLDIVAAEAAKDLIRSLLGTQSAAV